MHVGREADKEHNEYRGHEHQQSEKENAQNHFVNVGPTVRIAAVHPSPHDSRTVPRVLRSSLVDLSMLESYLTP